MSQSKKSKNKELSILPLSEQLQRLQAPKNNGRGVAAAREVVSVLVFGDRPKAKDIIQKNWDKFSNHPDIIEFFKQNNLVDPNKQH